MNYFQYASRERFEQPIFEQPNIQPSTPVKPVDASGPVPPNNISKFENIVSGLTEKINNLEAKLIEHQSKHVKDTLTKQLQTQIQEVPSCVLIFVYR